jgi:hypothetical protein
MTGMEHITYRHSAGSGFANVSRYAQGTTARNIVGYVDDALGYGTVTPNVAGAYMVEHNLGRVLGTNIPATPRARSASSFETASSKPRSRSEAAHGRSS